MPFQNYTSLLRDMQIAGKISNENLVSYVAKNPLPMFKYPVKKRFTFDCDIMSSCMLPSDVSEDYCVAYTKGDGNCLYNALSQHLSGGYSYANELRCRVAYQLIIQNQVYYDAAKECLYYDQPSQEYITNVATLGNFSNMVEVMAAANVLKITIDCHYPEVNTSIRLYFNKGFEAEFWRPKKKTKCTSCLLGLAPSETFGWNIGIQTTSPSLCQSLLWEDVLLGLSKNHWLELENHFQVVAAIDPPKVVTDEVEVPEKTESCCRSSGEHIA